jgi:hypothetical protein
MDIGKTLRCYTVEPLRDPVPRPRSRTPVAREGENRADREQPLLVNEEPTFAGVLAPSLVRRMSQ